MGLHVSGEFAANWRTHCYRFNSAPIRRVPSTKMPGFCRVLAWTSNFFAGASATASGAEDDRGSMHYVGTRALDPTNEDFRSAGPFFAGPLAGLTHLCW